MSQVTVKLSTPIRGHGGDIAEIILREPKFRDVLTLGEPSAFARSDGGMVFSAEREGVVEGYIARLLVEPKDPALLDQLSIADTLKLKEAVYGFFAAAREANSS